jgi:hypothetical protein
MRYYGLFLLLIIIFGAGKIQAQVLEDLKAPAMPAATIIGTQINEISRPKSLKALEAAVFNNFLDSSNNFLIPNNYAFEIDPFMLTKRTNFDYLEYLDDSLKHNLWRNLSFSVASTNNYIINDTITSNALGFGGRTIILNGKVNQELEKSYTEIIEKYKFLKKTEGRIRTKIDSYIENREVIDLDSLRSYLLNNNELNSPENTIIVNQVFDLLPGNTNKENIEEKFTDIYKETFSAQALDQFSKLIDLVKSERYGWRWEIDAALAMTFPTNEFNYCIVPKFGLWSNLSYKPFKKKELKNGELAEVPGNFEFIGLVRWINNDNDFMNKYNPVDTVQFQAGSVFDFGIRAVFEIKKFSAEIEYLYRLNQNKESVLVNGQEYSRTINDDTYKLVLNLNYNITDNIVLSYNLGKNFDMITNNHGNLITGFSINFGFGGADKDELIQNAMKKMGL